MTKKYLPKPALVTVCDLCGKEIREEPYTHSSIVSGYIAPKATGATKWYYLWMHKFNDNKQTVPDGSRRYDFHTECIQRLVEDNLNIYDLPNGDDDD